MRSTQWEFRVACVIEANLLPAFVHVAARAIRTKTTEVHVIDAVAALAVHCGRLVSLARVA